MHRLLIPFDILVVLFGATALILGTASSYDPALGYPVQRGILAGVGVYFIVAYGIRNWGMAYTLGKVFLLVTTAYAVLLISQYAYQNYGETPAFIEQLGIRTTFLPDTGYFLGHSNAVATFLEGTIPLGLVLVVTSRRWTARILWLVCIFVGLYVLMLTFSQGALVAVAATLVLTIFFLVRNKLFQAILVLLMAGGTLAMLWKVLQSSSALSRLTLYHNSLFVASDYFYTGIGLGNTFPLVYSRYGLLIQVPYLTYTHNLPLAIWLGQGLPGLLLAAALVILFYRLVWRVTATVPRRIFHAAWLGVTAMLIHGLFDSREYVEALWLMPVLFGFLGLAVATGRMALEDWTHDNPGWHVNVLPLRLSIALTLLLIAAAAIFNQQLRAAWYTNQGALAETRAELAADLDEAQRSALYAEAQADYQQALVIDPGWPNANRRSGNLYVEQEDFAPAVALLETAYAQESSNPAAIKGLGLAYTWNGKPEDAALLFNQLPDPGGMAKELLTWANWRGSDQKQQPLLAAYAYATAQLMNPNNVNTTLMRLTADFYRTAGDIKQARAWYERLLDVDPNNDDARQQLADLNAGS